LEVFAATVFAFTGADTFTTTVSTFGALASPFVEVVDALGAVFSIVAFAGALGAAFPVTDGTGFLEVLSSFDGATIEGIAAVFAEGIAASFSDGLGEVAFVGTLAGTDAAAVLAIAFTGVVLVSALGSGDCFVATGTTVPS
jgi:hypothetical protein